MFWSDVADKAVYRSKLDGSGKITFLNSNDGVGIVDGTLYSIFSIEYEESVYQQFYDISAKNIEEKQINRTGL